MTTDFACINAGLLVATPKAKPRACFRIEASLLPGSEDLGYSYTSRNLHVNDECPPVFLRCFVGGCSNLGSVGALTT